MSVFFDLTFLKCGKGNILLLFSDKVVRNVTKVLQLNFRERIVRLHEYHDMKSTGSGSDCVVRNGLRGGGCKDISCILF